MPSGCSKPGGGAVEGRAALLNSPCLGLRCLLLITQLNTAQIKTIARVKPAPESSQLTTSFGCAEMAPPASIDLPDTLRTELILTSELAIFDRRGFIFSFEVEAVEIEVAIVEETGAATSAGGPREDTDLG